MSTTIQPIDRARAILENGIRSLSDLDRKIVIPDDLVELYFSERCDCMNNLVVLRAGRAGCVRCGGHAAAGKQVWKCMCCGTCRVWGLEYPCDTDPAKLRCVSCMDVRLHRFMMVTRAH